MRIAFSRFQSVLPVICGPRTKAGAIAAHGLRNTRTGRQGQAGRQARRAAAGFKTVQRTGASRFAQKQITQGQKPS